jgi:hypothetical protein
MNHRRSHSIASHHITAAVLKTSKRESKPVPSIAPIPFDVLPKVGAELPVYTAAAGHDNMAAIPQLVQAESLNGRRTSRQHVSQNPKKSPSKVAAPVGNTSARSGSCLACANM